MRLVLPRAVYARTLLVAAAAAALVTTVLLTGFVQYAAMLPQAGVRAAVTEAPPEERTLLFSASAGDDAQEMAAQDAVVRELLAGGLAGAPLEVFGGGYGAGQQLPEFADADALVAFLPELASHARLRQGQWPRPAGADEAVQVALPVATAEELDVATGDQLVIRDTLQRQDRAALVVGVWEPYDPDGSYWQLLSARASMTGPFVVHRDEFGERYPLLASQLWLAHPDPGELAAAGMSEVVAGLGALEAELLHRRATDAALAENARMRTGMDELAERLQLATVVNRSGLVLPAALLAVIAGYGLVLVARLLVAHRRGENALLRARGASRMQLVRLTSAEAAMVVAPAALAGAPAGTWLVGWADGHAGGQSLGLAGDLAGYGLAGPPLAWLIALAAAAGCAVALAAPAAGRGRTWVAEQQERSRPGKLAVAQRAGTDAALVALAVLAWTQLRQYGQAVSPREVGGLGIDPLLVTAPVIGVLAATAVALRLLPAATRLGVRLAARREAFPTLLGMWQADRRPHAGPVLLLVLAVATAVLAPTVAATWQQSQRDQAAQLVGTDLRLAGTDRDTVTRAAGLAQHPEVAAAMPAQRGVALLPEGVRATMLAIDSQHAAQVTRVREDMSDAAPQQLFARLHDGRPALEVAPLPDGAQRLTGTVEFDAPDPVRVSTPHMFFPISFYVVDSQRLWLYVMDGHGVITPVRLDLPAPGEVVDVDVALPPGTVALVGLGAGLTVQSMGQLQDGQLTFGDVSVPVPEPTEASWRWELAADGDDADPVPVELPDSWQPQYPGPPPGDGQPEFARVGTDTAVAVHLDPAQHRGVQQPFLLSGTVPADAALPALATPDVLAAAGAEVGQVISLGDADLHLVGTMAVLPGTEDGSGLAVDLPWLSMQRFGAMSPTLPEVDEWWLATGATTKLIEEATAAGVRVVDQEAEARRLLDDPLGSGVLLALWTAAAAAALLAAFGLVVDARANAVRRGRELAVLHTLGASPPALARALVVEQAVLAGLGVIAGVAVGIAVSATMGTSLVLTPTGAVPVPEPLLTLTPSLFLLPTAGLFMVAVALGALVARRARRDIVAGALRIGED